MNVLQTAREVCKTLEISLPTLREVMREARITPSGHVRGRGKPSPVFSADAITALSAALGARRKRTHAHRRERGLALARGNAELKAPAPVASDKLAQIESEVSILVAWMKTVMSRLDRLEGHGTEKPNGDGGYVHTLRDIAGNTIGTISNGVITHE